MYRYEYVSIFNLFSFICSAFKGECILLARSISNQYSQRYKPLKFRVYSYLFSSIDHSTLLYFCLLEEMIDTKKVGALWWVLCGSTGRVLGL